MIGFPEILLEELERDDFKAKLQALRRTDNVTNWYYLARTYGFLSVVVLAATAFFAYRAMAGWSPWWDLPAGLLAIVMIGAGQHQLSGLAHEAAHRTLFQNRYFNDLVSDWFCSFPLFSSTYYYGLHHLAHHQFVNDPRLDPDLSQLAGSGHRLDFPLMRGDFLCAMAKQLWIPNLVRYALGRTAYDSLGTANSPYALKQRDSSNRTSRLLTGYVFFAGALSLNLLAYGDATAMAVLPLVGWAAQLLIFAALPAEAFDQNRVHPLIPLRAQFNMRAGFTTLLFYALAWGSRILGNQVIGWFLLLWVVPMFTSFAFFMLLRQWVQHGNADRACLTNTRVFLMNPFVRFAVFPFGQDYHLPHHMFATVPHYRLRELHEALSKCPSYRAQATVVEGYLFSTARRRTAPTVIEVVGPAYAPGAVRSVFIDDSVLDQTQLGEDEKAELLSESARAASTALETAGS